MNVAIGQLRVDPIRLSSASHRYGASDQRGHTDPEMKQEANADINRHPRQIEKRRWTAAGEKTTNLIKVTQRLKTIAIASRLQWQTNNRIKYPDPEGFFKVASGSDANAIANKVECSLKCIQDNRQGQQRQQRWYAATGQNPIVDLQHEERSSEHQNIAHTAEDRHTPEYLPA